MKKIVLAMAIALLSVSGALAQDEKKQEGNAPSKAEMIEHRTDAMVKRYGLDADQRAKLIELNTKYADMLSAFPRGKGRHGGQRPQGMRPDRNAKADIAAKDSLKKDRGPHERGRKGDFEKMRKMTDAYNTELKTIFTEKQFESYEADWAKMRERGHKPGDKRD